MTMALSWPAQQRSLSAQHATREPASLSRHCKNACTDVHMHQSRMYLNMLLGLCAYDVNTISKAEWALVRLPVVVQVAVVGIRIAGSLLPSSR